MKKFFVVLGLVFAGLLLIGVVGFGIFSYIGRGLDQDSKRFVDEEVPRIVSKWDVRELSNHASPKFVQTISPEKLGAFFLFLSDRLGPLKEYQDSKGDAGIKISWMGRKTVTAAYVVRLVFEKAPASINIRMIMYNNEWQIASFIVDSEALHK